MAGILAWQGKASYEVSVRNLAGLGSGFLPTVRYLSAVASASCFLAQSIQIGILISFDSRNHTGDFHPISSRPCWAYLASGLPDDFRQGVLHLVPNLCQCHPENEASPNVPGKSQASAARSGDAFALGLSPRIQCFPRVRTGLRFALHICAGCIARVPNQCQCHPSA